ncbi:PQQ-binding-like beta-propeller repeat protein [bacterium]|nr:PQQ-binding-like beta-propeller repeat protein [bacterium]MBT4649384.1 PQQ-binding-like beta-propeller repeat protein [bacterium]
MNSYNSTPPIIYNDLVVVQLVDSLWALDKDSGHVEWSLKLQDGRAVTYTVPQYDNYAFYCGKREVYKVDLETGMIVWEFQTASTTDVRHLSIDSEYLHFGTASGAYYQINLETGQLASYFMISGENVISATAHEDKVFICSYSPATFSGHLTCLVDGVLLWSNETSGIVSKPAFYDGKVFVSENPSSTVAYEVTTGLELHRYNGYSHPQLSPIIEDDCLYLSAPETITKIDLNNNQIIWTVRNGTKYDLVSDTDQFFVRFASRIRGYFKQSGEINFEYSPEDEAISAPCYDEGIIYFIGGAHVYAYVP